MTLRERDRLPLEEAGMPPNEGRLARLYHRSGSCRGRSRISRVGLLGSEFHSAAAPRRPGPATEKPGPKQRRAADKRRRRRLKWGCRCLLSRSLCSLAAQPSPPARGAAQPRGQSPDQSRGAGGAPQQSESQPELGATGRPLAQRKSAGSVTARGFWGRGGGPSGRSFPASECALGTGCLWGLWPSGPGAHGRPTVHPEMRKVRREMKQHVVVSQAEDLYPKEASQIEVG
ncbi:uncharacterized protein [Notamacropus eugenii]|uniref:uncharacterized protein n=1 Tax=Notamacropus eugenii TaxID=9315 RepID=UPI003B678919